MKSSPLVSLTLAATLATSLLPAYACGLPPAPDNSFESFISNLDPVDVLFVIFATLAIGAAVGPAILKGLGRLGRPAN